MAKEKHRSGKSKEQLKKEKEELKQLIIQHTEVGTGKRFTDTQIDRKNLIVDLQGGRKFYINEVERLMRARAREVEPKFKLEYYEQIYRLRGWDIEKAKEFIKPPEVADYTNELIYGRFEPEILEAMQILNPFLPGMFTRAHWHYQLLNDDGLVLLELYIDQAIALMKPCNTWYECRKQFKEQYGIGYQLDLFDENGNVK